ncbi:MAG: S8 family serine peptidase, partial [Planctomycetota bacterium]
MPTFENYEYVPNELLIQYALPAATSPSKPFPMPIEMSVVETIHTKTMQANGMGVLERVNLGAGVDMKAAMEEIKKYPNVLYVEPNFIYRTTAVSNDTYYTNGSLWGMYSNDLPTAIGPAGTTNQFGTQAEKAWNNDIVGNSNVVIGVIDEGIQFNHPDLINNMWLNPFEIAGDGLDNDGNGYIDDTRGWDFFTNDNSVYDGTSDDHGTHVAGTIGGKGGNGIGVAGVAWNVTMISVKFLGAGGGTTANAVKSLDYLTDLKNRHGLNIVATSNSWGGGGYSQSLHDAIIRSANRNILFVAAAGNAAANNDATPFYPANYNTSVGTSTQPAATYDAVISVASITNTGGLSGFSCFGATTVDIGAPGSGIWSTVPSNTYASYNGTSMATPHVSGAIALYASTKPVGTSALSIRQAILNSATPTASLAGKTVTGGRLNVYEAVRAKGSAVVSSPSPSATTTEAGGAITFTVVLGVAPIANVTIPVSSNDTTEGTVSTASLVFTPANWNIAQTVTVTGVNDNVDDGDINYSVVLGAATSTDFDYNGMNPSDVNLTNTDDDTAGITVSAPSGTTTTEAGGTVTFTVRLNSEPTANVTIPVGSNDTTEGTVSTASLVFTPANWNTAQTVTVTGVNDNVDDGDINYSAVLGAATSTDSSYSGLNPSDVNLTNTDDDTAGITVSAPSGTTTTEAGGTVTFTVRLNSEPTANVTIPVSSNDTTEGTVSTASLVFTPANWNTAQTVTVTGVNDNIDDGDISYSAVLGGATSTDSRYNGLNPSDVNLTNIDDDSAGITVSAPSDITTTEAGGTVTFTVRLNSEPTANVTIPLNSDDTTEGVVGLTSLIFTPTNWTGGVTITVTGVDDFLDDGDINYRIILGLVTSADSTYRGMDPSDVSLINQDDDMSGITVSTPSGTTTTEAGGTATFTLRLNAEPTANVAIPVSSSDGTEGTPSTSSIVFTPANWNTPQTITVTGVDDNIDDGDISYSILLGAATSADTNYQGINPSDLNFVNLDDDTGGIIVSAPSGTTTTEAGGTVTFTVRLTSEPTANVTIPVSSSDITEGTLSTGSLVFTPANWNAAQTVTVTGVNDTLIDGNISYTIILGAATSGDITYHGLNPSDINLINLDDDTAGITVSTPSSTTTTESGASASFTVRLVSAPTANVTIAVQSNDTTEGTVSVASLIFTPANWSLPQTITVAGVNDNVDDGDINYRIILSPATSADPLYNGLDPNDVNLTNIDDDTAGITVSAPSGTMTTESRGTVTFTVRLNSEPTANVTIPISSSDTTEGTVSPTSLVFTPSNWNVERTVTVTGVDDTISDGNINYTVIISTASSTDVLYRVINPPDILLTNIDNEAAPSRFWLVDDGVSDRSFGYDAGGRPTLNYALTSANTTPRGMATNPAGDRVWVVDNNRTVYVYNNAGILLGSWVAGSMPSNAVVEGIGTNGTHIWIVDNGSDRVYYYPNAATRFTGAQNASSNFLLNGANRNPKDLVTDGSSIWVVNDTASDRVFQYSVGGTLLKSWAINSANSSPTGITLDFSQGSQDLWIADNGTKQVYRYANARFLTAPTLTSSFPLATANSNPQGLAISPQGRLVGDIEVLGNSTVVTSLNEVTAGAWNAANVQKPRGEATSLVQRDQLFSQASQDLVAPLATAPSPVPEANGVLHGAPTMNGEVKTLVAPLKSTKLSSAKVREAAFAD